MLNLNCVICAELFAHTDDVHVTVCGHMFHYVCLAQWLERSKTCPQCRNKCSERNIIRLYFNLANLDTSSIDVGSLQEQLDNSKLLLQMKEKEMKKSDEQIKLLKASQKKCMKTITGLEENLKKNEFVLLSYMEQIKMLKSEANVTEELRKENRTLKQQLQTLDGISSILAASCEETEKLLKNERDPKKLGIWVTTLKRELKNCDSKNTNIRHMLRVVQSDLRQAASLNKKLEERISQLESECYQLNEKMKKVELPSSSCKIRHDTSIPNGESISSNLTLTKLEKKRLTISPTIKESIRKIEESDSPYLNIKSSSVGLLPYAFKRNQETGLMSKDVNTAVTTTKLAYLKVSPNKSAGAETETLRKRSSDLTEKYSILKRPRLVLSATSTTTRPTKPIASNLVFNGFGGSEKISPFERDSENDELVIGDDSKVTKSRGNLKSTATTSNLGLLKKTNSSNSSKLSERLKSGGLRNFMLSNRDNNDTITAKVGQQTTGQLRK